jgi:CRP-like cAMP-binding protein
MIDQTQWSNEFKWSEIETFAVHMCAYKTREGTIICRDGAQEGYMGLIVEGVVQIMKLDSERQDQVNTYLGPGKTF